MVICEGERERVIGCETVGDVLSQLASMGVDGDYLTNGRMGERLDDAERLSDIDGELWMRVRGRGGARGLDINDGGGDEGGCESGQGDEPMGPAISDPKPERGDSRFGGSQAAFGWPVASFVTEPFFGLGSRVL